MPQPLVNMKSIVPNQEVKNVIDRLRSSQFTIGAAESCTGGLFSQCVTSIPGASDVFMGAFVTYSNDIKSRILGVDEQALAAHGAVSEAVALEMANAARKLLRVDIAVSATGIAGPGGGTSTKPVGTVWIGVSTPANAYAKLLQLTGDREEIRVATVRKMLHEIDGVMQAGAVK